MSRSYKAFTSGQGVSPDNLQSFTFASIADCKLSGLTPLCSARRIIRRQLPARMRKNFNGSLSMGTRTWTAALLPAITSPYGSQSTRFVELYTW